ncbi:hypothetical protein PoB_002678800 [Plakobranchus ocellatus]|uniref:Uncharacterized protein n=1 Tax=Plakobranchus ocellatus TaxID=259542 RepID=A0AAV4A0W9_9GAST|nr:hypothetical protein PoB_002678800 [Plakobranchus ocellatus]
MAQRLLGERSAQGESRVISATDRWTQEATKVLGQSRQELSTHAGRRASWPRPHRQVIGRDARMSRRKRPMWGRLTCVSSFAPARRGSIHLIGPMTAFRRDQRRD